MQGGTGVGAEPRPSFRVVLAKLSEHLSPGFLTCQTRVITVLITGQPRGQAPGLSLSLSLENIPEALDVVTVPSAGSHCDL